MHKRFGKLVLGLETGIDGGSLSILENDVQIDSACGSGRLSKSEDLLYLLEKLLERNSIDKSEIGLVVVSDEPGSLTGLRIGLSMAGGLSDALSVPLRKLSILDALATMGEADGPMITAVFTESRGVFFREYISKKGELSIKENTINKKGIAEFILELESRRGGNEKLELVFNSAEAHVQTIEEECFVHKIPMTRIEGNLAEILGKASIWKVRPIT